MLEITVCSLAHGVYHCSDLEILTFSKGQEIFAKGAHDGSIMLVASGEASLTIHGDKDDQRFKKIVRRGDSLMSSLSLLTALINGAPNGERSRQSHKICGNLSAVSDKDDTTVFRIPTQAIQKVTQAHPDSFFRLAQAAFSQVEKITAKSLMHHFGLYAKIVKATPLVHPLLMSESVSSDTKRECVESVAESIGLYDQELRLTLVDCAEMIPREKDQTIAASNVKTSGVYVVVEGSATVQVQTQNNQFVDMYTATKGCEIGLAACFVGHHSSTRVVCKEDTVLVRIPDALFSSLLQIHSVAVCCARHLVEQYSELVCITDSSFDWLHLHGGESLFDQGDVCNSVLTVISGRLRAVQVHYHRGKEVETTSDLVRGATLGAMDMLAAGRSNSSVFAIRDSQIAQMSRNVFDFIVSKYPTVLIHFTTNLAQHLTTRRTDITRADPSSIGQERNNYLLSLSSGAGASHEQASSRSLPLGTVAVLSLTKMTKIETFCSHLLASLKTIATTEVVSSQKASAYLGDQWITNSRVDRANLSTWLGDIESSNELVIYEADAQLTPWTKLCIRQADHILLLCSDTHPQHAFLSEMATILQDAWEKKSVSISVVRIRKKDWTLSAVEEAARLAAHDASRTNALKKKLRISRNSEILPRFLLPMEKYEWISSFHNVQFPFEAHQPDFLRLCRRITGNAVGVVLGGGGARGLAHIGVLRALEECGIHVDVVGGTSIGAFIGAIYALHPHDLTLVESKVHALSLSMSSIMEKLRDLTLPISSFFNGSRFNRSIQEFFYDLSIEDLMLNYFCVSTDIAKSRMSVHHSGHVWKYVRASMSLQGYLPPISEDGSLLLDGGYMNNLPADVMKEEGGIKYIVAVDVGSEPRRGYFSYGSSLSGWWLLWNKINPFAKTVIVPSMGDVSAALAYVSSEQHKDRMKAECIDLYLRPPVNDYGTLQFDKMEEIIRVGYEYALPRIQAWAAQVLTSEPDADLVEASAKTPKRDDKRAP
ncbi:Patatin like protein, partial [Globisporangium splendens]